MTPASAPAALVGRAGQERFFERRPEAARRTKVACSTGDVAGDGGWNATSGLAGAEPHARLELFRQDPET